MVSCGQLWVSGIAVLCMPNVGVLGDGHDHHGGFGDCIEPSGSAVASAPSGMCADADESSSETGSMSRGSAENDAPRQCRPRRRGAFVRGWRGRGQGNDIAHGRDMLCYVCDLEAGGGRARQRTCYSRHRFKRYARSTRKRWQHGNVSQKIQTGARRGTRCVAES